MATSTVVTVLDIGDGRVLDIGDGRALQVSGGPCALPLPWLASCRYLDFSHDVTPPMGGPAQRFGRLGARWSVTFSSLPALGLSDAQSLIATRTTARANGSTVIFAWPQPAFTAAIGVPAVNGAGQLGTSLIVNGLTPGAVLTPGLFFSMLVGTRSYLSCLTAAATADGGGNATLSIAPMLRASPADATTLNFVAPQIEGFIAGQTEDWTLERLAWVGLSPFTVNESQ